MSKRYINLLRKTALEKGITQKQISEKTGIPIRTLSRYFNGSRLPDVETALDIAKVLGKRVDELFIDKYCLPFLSDKITIDKSSSDKIIHKEYFGCPGIGKASSVLMPDIKRDIENKISSIKGSDTAVEENSNHNQ